MKTYLFPAGKLTLICILFFVIIYGASIWGIAYVVAPNHGRGEVVVVNGKVVGFTNVGQSFTANKYFWSRPSAVNYNAAGSAGSNKGASNADYLKQVEERLADFTAKNPGVKREEIPVDMITASGSGLDPHISVQAAMVQIARIAKERGVAEEKIKGLVDQYTQEPLLGLFGTTTVHVLKLNIALDNIVK